MALKISPWIAALTFLLFFTAFTRLFHLGQTPSGITWDEAALGYVGKMVVTTGRDEHGRLLPRTFLSFGDYKAPLAFYITGISTTLFGLTPWATRLPFALAGIVSVWLMVQIGARVFQNRWYGLLCGWLLALTPWHLLFSRVAFESGLALCFFLLTLWSWIMIRSEKNVSWRWGLMGVIGVVGALYTYHSAKIVIPGLILMIFWHEWEHHRHWLQKNAFRLGQLLAATAVLLLPLIHSFFFDKAGERAQQTLIIFQDGTVMEKISAVLNGFMTHFSLQFLIFGQTDVLRHGTGMYGVLTFAQAALLLIGVSYALAHWIDQATTGHSHALTQWIRQLLTRPHDQKGIAPGFWLGLTIIGVLPAALGFELPHANRALLALPALLFLMAYGIKKLQEDKHPLLFSSLVGSLLLIVSLEFCRFWTFYHGPYRIHSSSDWLQGYAEAVSFADSARLQGKTVKFTTQYGQPEIFFGFALDIPAQEYREVRVRGVTFGPVAKNDLNQFDMVIAAPSEMLATLPKFVVEHADHTPAFYVYEKN